MSDEMKRFYLVSLQEKWIQSLAGREEEDERENYEDWLNNEASGLQDNEQGRVASSLSLKALERESLFRGEMTVSFRRKNDSVQMEKEQIQVFFMGPRKRCLFITEMIKDRQGGGKVTAAWENQLDQYIFKWNVEKDKIELTDSWKKKFNALNCEGKLKYEIEKYIFADDIVKFRTLLNDVIDKKEGIDIALRFYSRSCDSAIIWCELSFSSIICREGRVKYVVGQIKDIHKRIQLLKDSLLEQDVNIYGKEQLLPEIEKAVSEDGTAAAHAVLAVSICDYQQYRDFLGESIGKLVFQWFLKTLVGMVYEKDIVGRVDEETIFVFLRNIGGVRNTKEKINHIIYKLDQLGDSELNVKIGVSLSPEDGVHFQELLDHALLALADIKYEEIPRSQFYNKRIEGKPGRSINGPDEPKKSITSISYNHLAEISPEMMGNWYRMVQRNISLQRDMDVMRSQILLSQIKPHFIYNVLANIKAIISTDTVKAESMLVAFTKYLRTLMNALKNDEFVSFQENIDEIKNFITIENIRFPGKISVHYDLQYIDFEIPHFILQPLVENAIKHGICKKEGPGSIEIRSYVSGKSIVIEVEDDGVGCDKDLNNENMKVSGVGIANVRKRIRCLLGGRMTVDSKPGVGTKVTITI